MSSGRVVVVGSLNLDVVYRVDELPRPGETVLGGDLERLSGGKGGNQAHAAACAAPPGVGVAMVARVGDDDAGERLTADLARVGVDVHGIERVAGPSGTALIAVDRRGENTIVVVPGANGSWPTAAIDDLDLAAGDVAVVQLEIPLDVVARVVRRARDVGARVVLNAAPFDPRVRDLVPLVDVVVVNEVEAAELFDLDLPIDADAVAAAARLLTGDLVVTLGAHGVVVASPREAARRLPAFRVDAVDSVGAGDAFVGGLAAALAAGMPLEAAVRRGSAAGALTATVRGARHPHLDSEGVSSLVESVE